MKIKNIISFILLIIHTNNVYSSELEINKYYSKYINSNIVLNNIDEIREYSFSNDDLFTIGCVSKSIFAATIILFSYDINNEYLFKNKGLNITIGELLNNRKNYLKSLEKLTNFQKEKLNFINRLLPTMNTKILNTEVYKVLNHTSVFADDLNKYLLYLIAQKVINVFSNDDRNILIFNGIQYLSLKKNEQDIKAKYSNMGFMYLIGIMSLVTDKIDFYQEVNKRIFKPLNLEDKFIRVDSLSTSEIMKKFKDQNYYETIGRKKLKLDIYDFKYNEMDTLNGGLISDLNSIIAVGSEISKMYLGFKNKLTDNTNISFDYFCKYRTEYGEDEYNIDRYYSLGSIFYILDDKIIIRMAGNVFGKRTIINFISNKIQNNKLKNNNCIYDKNNYDENLDINANLIFENNFLKNVFFSGPHIDLEYSLFVNILAKSIYNNFKDGETINLDDIEWYVNYNPKKLVKELEMEVNSNILELTITKEEQNKLKEEFAEYFEKLKELLNLSN